MHTRSRRLQKIQAALQQAERDARGDFPQPESVEQAQEYAQRYHTAIERHTALLNQWVDVVADGTARSAGKRASSRDAATRDAQATWQVADWLFKTVPRLRIGANKADVNRAVDLATSPAAPLEVQQWVKRQPNGVTHANVKKLMQRWRGRKPARHTLSLRKPTSEELRAILGISHIRVSK